MTAMRLLVTGAAGMLGTDVVATAAAQHDVVAFARADLDITDADAVRAVVRDVRPDALINCAAWTNVDLAEGPRERLAITLRAYLDRPGQVQAIASALEVHPQTVRYRLKQLRELFGSSLEDPDARFELSLALRAAGSRRRSRPTPGSSSPRCS